MTRFIAIIVACLAFAGCASTGVGLARGDAARQQVVATERAFAKTMADRDLNAFRSFLSQETIFFSGGKALRGPDAVVAYWSRFYSKREAPFSWEPNDVEVLDSGTLALSSGPVHDAQGKRIGCFQSIWRQEAPGRWKIVFDRGSSPDNCAGERK